MTATKVGNGRTIGPDIPDRGMVYEIDSVDNTIGRGDTAHTVRAANSIVRKPIIGDIEQRKGENLDCPNLCKALGRHNSAISDCRISSWTGQI